MSQKVMELVEKASMKPTVPEFEIGDTVDVHTKILEGNKERIQIFTGLNIQKYKGKIKVRYNVKR